jgi:hypothetical protein
MLRVTMVESVQNLRSFRPLDPSGILCRPPLDPSAGVCFVKQKVDSSIPPGPTFHPTYLTGRAIKGTWGGKRKKK